MASSLPPLPENYAEGLRLIDEAHATDPRTTGEGGMAYELDYAQKMTKWLADPALPKPTRIADIVVIAKGGKVYDGLVDLKEGKITKWEVLDGLQPIVSPLMRRRRTREYANHRRDHHGGAHRC